ncbi:unnamed protein product [Rangifer tarandus platyrhynchus]|uniref:Uncharacterized protein n=1 Tax=Rangifer tarandus platyrhynchus TaxID=3082113 RepID=A0ABN9A1E5_RANTA|nr:unnamed protein product [Rangifer tarandus platyrhynchus]
MPRGQETKTYNRSSIVTNSIKALKIVHIKKIIIIIHASSLYSLRIVCVHAESLQPCLTQCDLVDCSPPGLLCPWGSPGKNILQWVARPSSRGSSRPRDRTCISRDSCIGRQFFFACRDTREA